MSAWLLPQAREAAARVAERGVVGGASSALIRAGVIDHCSGLQSALEALKSAPHWHLPAVEPPPADEANLYIAAVMRCCHPGARFVANAARLGGKWRLPFRHDVDIVGWMRAPVFPALLAPDGGEQ